MFYLNILSDEGPAPNSISTIIGKVETGVTIFEHTSGKGIGLDSKISLVLEGNQFIETTVDDLLDNNGKENGDWNIGERLIYIPDPDSIPPIISDKIQIKGSIVDTYTNTLVFKGILQEGYTVPSHGRGGIWHFDEGIGSIAKDSSGNNNHGDIFGSSWYRVPGIKDYYFGTGDLAIFFDNRTINYVRVENGPGLYIEDEITVEAWINPLDTSGGLIDDYLLDEKASGITWIHISGDIFAFAYWYTGEGANCRIQTIDLSPTGQIGETAIDSIDFFPKKNINGFDPDFIHIANSVYAVAHRFTKDNGYVTTIEIFDNGTISNDTLDRFEFERDPSNTYNPEIIHVSGNIYAIVSSEKVTNGSGNVHTIEILPDGTISKTVIDEFEFESDDCSHPKILKIYDNKYVIAYSSSDNGFIKTIEIENNGIINKSIIDNFEFESIKCFETDLEFVISNESIESNIYTIAYRGSGDNGFVNTVEVKNNGTITKSTIDILEFDPNVYGGQPDIARIEDSNHTFAIAYLGPRNYGYLSTIKIFNNGTILDTIIDTIQFSTDRDTNNEMWPTIVYRLENIYGIAYKGHAGSGYLISLSLQNSGKIGGPKGIGGIFKDHSYALIVDSNTTKAYGTVNNITINTTGIISNNWNYVALTYNGSSISLYVFNEKITNPQNQINISYPYNEKINFTSDDLYFGYLFYGLIDEIAIHDRALNSQELYAHYINPGYFENEP